MLSCCAPCSAGVIKKLALQGRHFSVLFYNPNIDQAQEYQKRLTENKRLCAAFGVEFIELPYEHEFWCKATQGLETEPERGKRCSKCFYMRLERTARYAKEHGFTHFSSVLGISRHKDLEQVNEQASQVSAQENILYDFTNWRKGGTEELRREVIKEMQLYNQTYCGCAFSHRGQDEKTT